MRDADVVAMPTINSVDQSGASALIAAF